MTVYLITIAVNVPIENDLRTIARIVAQSKCLERAVRENAEKYLARHPRMLNGTRFCITGGTP
jgi:hypothetical protein